MIGRAVEGLAYLFLWITKAARMSSELVMAISFFTTPVTLSELSNAGL